MTLMRRAPRNDLRTISRAFDSLFDDASFNPLAWGFNNVSLLPLDITST